MWPMLAIVRGVAEDADLLVCVCVSLSANSYVFNSCHVYDYVLYMYVLTDLIYYPVLCMCIMYCIIYYAMYMYPNLYPN